MISDAYVTCTCDVCFEEEVMELTALAMRGAYDSRNVKSKLRRLGWIVPEDGDDLTCPECAPDAALASVEAT